MPKAFPPIGLVKSLELTEHGERSGDCVLYHAGYNDGLGRWVGHESGRRAGKFPIMELASDPMSIDAAFEAERKAIAAESRRPGNVLLNVVHAYGKIANRNTGRKPAAP